jgi:hypothetical protein
MHLSGIQWFYFSQIFAEKNADYRRVIAYLMTNRKIQVSEMIPFGIKSAKICILFPENLRETLFLMR